MPLQDTDPTPSFGGFGLRAHSSAYFPNFMLLGDLNLDYDNPATDRARIEQRIKGFNMEWRKAS